MAGLMHGGPILSVDWLFGRANITWCFNRVCVVIALVQCRPKLGFKPLTGLINSYSQY